MARRRGPWQRAAAGLCPELLSEEQSRVVACRRCGAPAKHWCSLSRARLKGAAIHPGDWRGAHDIRQRDALAKIMATHAERDEKR
jgi:hypothetical protein